MKPHLFIALLCVLTLLAPTTGIPAGASLMAATTTRVSVTALGVEGNSWSAKSIISANGRYVVFGSWANNLVAGDTSQFSRVSVTSAGGEADSVSLNPALSPDARYIAFTSSATNLAEGGDTNDEDDVFIRDRQTGQTTRVSVSSSGTQTGQFERSDFAALSADGRYVAFESTGSDLVSGDTNGLADIFVRDRQTNQTTRISVTSGGAQSEGESNNASISSDGRLVAFDSFAGNLAPDDENAVTDVFVHDRVGAPRAFYLPLLLKRR